jgi:hypothetical protein
MAQETKETARQLKDEAIHSATGAAREAQAKAVGYADQQKDRVADELHTFGEAMSRAAEKLREDEDARVAGYADLAADQFNSAADYLRTRELGDLVGDLESLARRRPEVFFGGTFLIGLGVARFLKASRRRRGAHDGREISSERPSRAPYQEDHRSESVRATTGMNDPLSYH